MTLTPEDLQALKEIFATKDDLAGLATKADLKAQAETIATKDDLKTLSMSLDKKLEQVKMEIIESIADTIHSALIPLLDNHEERIERLEKLNGLAPLPLVSA